MDPQLSKICDHYLSIACRRPSLIVKRRHHVSCNSRRQTSMTGADILFRGAFGPMARTVTPARLCRATPCDELYISSLLLRYFGGSIHLGPAKYTYLSPSVSIVFQLVHSLRVLCSPIIPPQYQAYTHSISAQEAMPPTQRRKEWHPSVTAKYLFLCLLALRL